MPDGPATFSNPDFSQYNRGANTGNPIADMLGMLMMGHSFAPTPQGNQSVYDSYLIRERSRQFLNIQQTAFANNMMFRAAGFNPQSGAMLGAGLAFGGPDGLGTRLVAPFVGGNPVAAQMGLYANLTGQTMGTFGRIGNVGAGETTKMMNELYKGFYRQKEIDPAASIAAINQGLQQQFAARPDAARQFGVNPHNFDIQRDFSRLQEQRFKTERVGGVLSQIQQGLDSTATILTPNSTDSRSNDMVKNLTEFANKQRKDLKEFVNGSGFDVGSYMNSVQYQDPSAQPNKQRRAELEKFKVMVDQARIERRKNLLDELKKHKTDIDESLGAGSFDKYMQREKDMVEGKFDGSSGAGVPGLIAALQKKNDPIAKYINDYENLKDRQKRGDLSVAAGIDYGKTRGFSIEDFTGGFSAASDLRLVGRNGGNLGRAMAGFAQNAGGVLDAARSVFGDKSGGKLMEDISSLLGTKSADLTSAAGSQQVEDLLRKMKAASRSAGASIDAVVGIINEAKNLAQSKPGLQYVGGNTITEITMKALQTTTGMNAILSNDAMRREGGTQGMTASNVSEKMRLMESDVSKQAATLAYALEDQTFKDDQGNSVKASDYIRDFMKSHPMNERTFTDLTADMSRRTGSNINYLMEKMMDPNMQKMAMSKYGDLGKEAAENTAYSKFEEFAGSAKGGLENAREALRKALASGEPVDIKDIYSKNINSKTARDFMNTYGNTIYDRELEKIDPSGYGRTMDHLRKHENDMVEDDKRLSKQMGHLNAPIIQQAMQKLFSGEFTEKGVSSLLNIFRDYDEQGNDITDTSAVANTIDPQTGKAVTKQQYIENRTREYRNLFKNKDAKSVAGFLAGRHIKGLDGKDMTEGGVNNLISIANRHASYDTIKQRISELSGRADSLSTAEKQELADLQQLVSVGVNSQEDLDAIRKGPEGIGQSMVRKDIRDDIERKTSGAKTKAYSVGAASANELIAQKMGGGRKDEIDAYKKILSVYSSDGKTMTAEDQKRLIADMESGDIDEKIGGKGGHLSQSQQSALRGIAGHTKEDIEAIDNISAIRKDGAAGGATQADIPGLLQKILQNMDGGGLVKALEKLAQSIAPLTRDA